MEKLVTDNEGMISAGDQLLVDGDAYTQRYLQFLQEHNPDDVDAYLKTKDAEIFTGKPAWKRRNFDSTFGVVYDLYIRQNHFASVEVNDDGYVEATIMPAQGNEAPVVLDSFDRVSKEKNLIEAIARIEALLPEEV